VSCTAAVLDVDPNPVFDGNGHCNPGGQPLNCTPDAATAHPPLGVVQFVDNSTPTPTVLGSCILSHENGASRPNALIPQPLYAQPEYASWCSQNLALSTGMQLTVEYQGEGAATAHQWSTSPVIDID
jgi:hypothetical protein